MENFTFVVPSRRVCALAPRMTCSSDEISRSGFLVVPVIRDKTQFATAAVLRSLFSICITLLGLSKHPTTSSPSMTPQMANWSSLHVISPPGGFAQVHFFSIDYLLTKL